MKKCIILACIAVCSFLIFFFGLTDTSLAFRVFWGNYDTNGDGLLDQVYSENEWIIIYWNGGTTYTKYYVGTAYWTILNGGFVDTNGYPGVEICISYGGHSIKIISDNPQGLSSTYYIHPSNPWVVTGFQNIDGYPGVEILYIFSWFPENQYRWALSDRRGVIYTY